MEDFRLLPFTLAGLKETVQGAAGLDGAVAGPGGNV